jgi:hypothetical protein
VAIIKSRASKRGTLDEKWQELDFPLLLNSTLKCVALVIKMAVPRIATASSLNWRAEYHRTDLAECNPCYLRAGVRQSAEHLRAVVVANRGTRARSLAED